jgi:hypothetical protein
MGENSPNLVTVKSGQKTSLKTTDTDMDEKDESKK